MGLPPIGRAYLIPIVDGHYTFAWVVGPHVIEGNPYQRVALACAAWIGAAPPTQRELDARRVRELFDIKGKSFGPLVIDTHEAIPRQWKAIGTVNQPAVPHKPLWTGGWT